MTLFLTYSIHHCFPSLMYLSLCTISTPVWNFGNNFLYIKYNLHHHFWWKKIELCHKVLYMKKREFTNFFLFKKNQKVDQGKNVILKTFAGFFFEREKRLFDKSFGGWIIRLLKKNNVCCLYIFLKLFLLCILNFFLFVLLNFGF